MLPNAKIVSAVMLGADGVLAGARPGTIVVDMSSVSPEQTRQMAGQAKDMGLSYLDAPVSGGVGGAEKGSLTIMVGGPAEVIDRTGRQPPKNRRRFPAGRR